MVDNIGKKAITYAPLDSISIPFALISAMKLLLYVCHIGDSSLTPPLLLLRSRMKGILKPSIMNWLVVNNSSMITAVISSTSKSFNTIGISDSNLVSNGINIEIS